MNSSVNTAGGQQTIPGKQLVLDTLISNLDTRYISKHPSHLLLSITKHLLMIAHKLSKVLIAMRKDQQTLLSLRFHHRQCNTLRIIN
jgi:hypothetical protein